MTTSIELAFPVKHVERIYEFANFRVGQKNKGVMINDIQVVFLPKKTANVIVHATDNQGFQFRKEFLCNIHVQNLVLTRTCLVTFSKINSDKQDWYKMTPELISSILAK
jgi:hypothetical protein